MAVITKEDFNARLRTIVGVEDHLTQLQMLADLLTITLDSASDQANVASAIATELARRLDMPPDERNGPF
jgi:hypothetical protein